MLTDLEFYPDWSSISVSFVVASHPCGASYLLHKEGVTHWASALLARLNLYNNINREFCQGLSPRWSNLTAGRSACGFPTGGSPCSHRLIKGIHPRTKDRGRTNPDSG